MKPAKVILILLVFALGDCKSLRFKTSENNDVSLYRQAIRNAIYPEAEELYDQLVPVAKENVPYDENRIDEESKKRREENKNLKEREIFNKAREKTKRNIQIEDIFGS